MKKVNGWFYRCLIITLAWMPHAFADTLLLADFEDSAITISTYKGSASSIAVSYVTDIVHTKDYSGAVYNSI